MNNLTEKELLDEIDLCAEIFIRSGSDECDNAVFETYRFTYEELHVFLICFGNGLIEQMKLQPKTAPSLLKEAVKVDVELKPYDPKNKPVGMG